MTSRDHIPVKVKVDVAIGQAMHGAIRCGICKGLMVAEDDRILEHNPPRALLVANGVKNPDDPKYLSWVHAACADKKTNGASHVKVDGDISKIAKAKRLSIARRAKDEVETRVGHDPGYRLKKKLDGSVVRVRTK